MSNANSTAFDFVTDTGTLCIYDTAALRHRLNDEDDWWSLPEEEIAEVNAGNVAFIGIGGDGRFTVTLRDVPFIEMNDITIKLNCPTGQLFIGAGEEVTSGGFEPELIRGGHFHNVPPGCYDVHVRRLSGNELEVALCPTDVPAENHFTEPVRL